MKRFLSLLLILTLCMQMMVVSTAAADTTSADTTSADTSDIKTLSFQPFDSVSNSDGTVIYMTSRSEKRVYSINTYNFTVSFITFDLMPEALCYKDGKLYVALCTRDHYSCWWKEDQSGAFAIIDCSTFTKTAQYNINIDPYDIAVSNENNIYITCGSGQFGYIGGYTQQGVLINTSSICQLSTLVYNSTLDRLYTIDDMVMPLDMTAYTLDSTGKITSSYVWKYHNDFDTSNLFDISPDGKYIFNNIGYIATCAAAQSEDMIKRDEPFVPFNGISFDLANDAFYLAGIDNRVHQYQYSNLTPTKDYAVSSGIPQSVYKTLDGIVIITKDNNSVYRIEKATTTVSSATDNDYGAAFKNEFSAFVYDPGHNKTYLLNKGTKKLFVFNDSTGTIEKAVSLDYRPDGINISSDGTKILIVNDNRVYLVTELDINTLQKTREIIYSIPENLNETCHRHIIEGQGKIFIIDGDIEIHAYVFDQNTLAYLGNFGLPTGISDIKIDDSGKYMYISTQQSWLINMDDSNYSLIYKYDITKDAAVLTDCFNPSNYTVSCGPVDSPIILCKDSLYFKKLKFSASDLKTNNILFPETI
ncbi:MAG: hypothetical protein Q8865_10425, partial [Bacillota bacterium]|nr:hypothetical protein [Bacillota bacterium]